MSSDATNRQTSSRSKSDDTFGSLIPVPDSLKSQLGEFRKRVWSTKITEAIALAAVAVLLAFLTVYVADRFFDTPAAARLTLFLVAVAIWTVVPWALHRWVWKNRRLDQLARLLRVREPSVGDQLLSVIELAEDESEQARSKTLCAAAIRQVATSAKDRDFKTAAPPTRLRSLGITFALSGLATVALWALFPDAAQNAWARFSAPWRETPRYTFTMLKPQPAQMVVPHGESVSFGLELEEDTKWRPDSASLQFGDLEPIVSELDGSRYEFELPPLTTPMSFRIRVGDFSQVVSVEPKIRPELVGAVADVELPKYLQWAENLELDARSGVVSAVRGSTVTVRATASRALQSAMVNSAKAKVDGESFFAPPVAVEDDAEHIEFKWQDYDDLSGRDPFSLQIKPLEDELPSVVSQGLPKQSVVLISEQLNFETLVSDDFGVQRVGISWRSLDESVLEEGADGEKAIGSGKPNQTSMQLPATFCAEALGIPAQPIEVRLWAEDYNPEHQRVHSAPHVFFVLTAEQHAVWITNQLSKWHRAALEVRDQEMRLHAKNKELRSTPQEELANKEMQDALRRQASLEQANGRRLGALAKQGEGLLRQAARNEEIGVGHLDRWAEMLEIINDIGTKRMPSVSDLLQKTSKQGSIARSKMPSKNTPMAGQIRNTKGGAGGNSEPKKNLPEQPTIPKVADSESSMQPVEPEEEGENGKPKKKYNGSRQGLVTTTLTGPPKKSDGGDDEEEQDEEEDTFEEALIEQENLLAEFEKVADELNQLLANLEGSTLVKRLKAASREQNQVAEKISTRIDSFFGKSRSSIDDDGKTMLVGLSSVEEKSSQEISYIMDDMQAYFERRRMNQFKVVLEDMKESGVINALTDLGEAIPKEQGMSIAQAEFWSDSLDRWAEDLVDPACSGQCPGCKTSDSLPPSLILEVLRILEGEVNLREDTRVAEQARSAIDAAEHSTESSRLADAQKSLRERTDKVVFNIEELPKGSQRFGKEIKLLSSVSRVMSEATGILSSENTGVDAIAAETEAIELLLQCKRINPKSGGGGGTSPGGGGSGDTKDSALALLGSGLNQNEKRESRDVGQSTGETGRKLPEEFRAGLDAYFSKIEAEQ